MKISVAIRTAREVMPCQYESGHPDTMRIRRLAGDAALMLRRTMMPRRRAVVQFTCDQDASGSYVVMPRTTDGVSGPRSFWWITPS